MEPKLFAAAACGAGLASLAWWYSSSEKTESSIREETPPYIPADFSLAGKVAFITGGARDFGLEIAEGFAEAGCHLIITSRNITSAEAAAEDLRQRFPSVEVLAMALDVCSFEAVSEAATTAIAWKHHVDIVVNNAGGSPGAGGGIFERDPKDITNVITLNLLGTMWVCKAFGEHLSARPKKYGAGKVINIASIAGLLARDSKVYDRNKMRRQPTDYAAAKAGVIGFTRDFAGIMGPKGVRVNAISPGGFGPRPNGPPAQFWKDYSDRTCLGHPGRVGDLKGLVLFLASPASDYVHGEMWSWMVGSRFIVSQPTS